MGRKSETLTLLGQPAPAPTKPSTFKKLCCRTFKLILHMVFVVSFISSLCSLFPTIDRLVKNSLSALFPPQAVDPCTELLVPPPGTYLARLAKLSDALSPPLLPSEHAPSSLSSDPQSTRTNASAGTNSGVTWIAEPGPSAEYFLGGFSSLDWWLSERPFLIAVSPTKYNSNSTNSAAVTVTLLTPQFEELRARGVALPAEIRDIAQWVSWQESESPYEVLLRHLDDPAPFIMMDGQVRTFISEGIWDTAVALSPSTENHTGCSGVGTSVGQNIKYAVALIRQRKDKREIDLLRCANQASFGLDMVCLSGKLGADWLR
jgi:hypothetical protein